jgi:signal transduction histidine kinase
MRVFKLRRSFSISLIYVTIFITALLFIPHARAEVYSAQEPGSELVQSGGADDDLTAEETEQLKVIVILLVVFAFIAMFGLIYVVKSHRELKNNYRIIETQRNEISEKNEALAFQNESLEELNIEKNNMLSVVAHDLKVPLGNIQGLVGLLLLEKDKLTKQQLDYLDIIKKVVIDGTNMVNNMLNVHKIESELQQMNLAKHDLIDIVNTVIRSHESLAATKNIVVELKDSPDELWINTDKQYFHQIISNLLSNAIKFSPENSTVSICFHDRDYSVLVSVCDEGPGISPEDQKRLFSGYQKITSNKTGEQASTGFGLAIVRRLVEKLDGKIKIESELDKGTTISVEFMIPSGESTGKG